MATIPTFEKYAGPSSLHIQIGALGLWYSYDTVVAFYHPSTGRRVRVNAWGPTTGKHLNAIDDGDKTRGRTG